MKYYNFGRPLLKVLVDHCFMYNVQSYIKERTANCKKEQERNQNKIYFKKNQKMQFQNQTAIIGVPALLQKNRNVRGCI